MENLNATQLSDKELEQELRRRKKAKTSDRDAYKALVEETVPNAIGALSDASKNLSLAKTLVYQFFEDVLALKEKAYDIKEKQRSHTFTSKNGEVTIGYRINDGWDDTVHAGIAKVEKFISSLAKDESTALLVETVFGLLKKDSKGNLKGNRVMELRQMTDKFDSPEFTDGVEIILAAYKPVRSSWYIEAYKIDDNGVKTAIPLNISSVDFSEGYKFDHFNEVSQ